LNELAELDALDAELTATAPPVMKESKTIHLPAAPSSAVNVKISQRETDEEREIRELEASMLA